MKITSLNKKRTFLKFVSIISILILSISVSAQFREHNITDTFYYFKEFDYCLNKNSFDTSFIYLKADSKNTDIEKISSKYYNGEFEYATFRIDRSKKTIFVKLFDLNKKELNLEFYHFDDLVTSKSDKYYFNVSGTERVLTWKVITPILY